MCHNSKIFEFSEVTVVQFHISFRFLNYNFHPLKTKFSERILLFEKPYILIIIKTFLRSMFRSLSMISEFCIQFFEQNEKVACFGSPAHQLR